MEFVKDNQDISSILSPVSKMERIKQSLRIDQQARARAAPEDKVKIIIERTSKRKGLGLVKEPTKKYRSSLKEIENKNSVDSMHSTLTNISVRFENAPDQVDMSTTRSRFCHQNKEDNLLEGEAIKGAFLGTPLSHKEQLREALQAESVPPPFGGCRRRKNVLVSPDFRNTKMFNSPELARATDTHILKEDNLDSFIPNVNLGVVDATTSDPEFRNPNFGPSSAEDERSSRVANLRPPSKFYTIVVWLLAIVILVGLWKLWVDSTIPDTPFCDSEDRESVKQQACVPCPGNGTCAKGILQSCVSPYRVNGNTCIEGDGMQQNVTFMENFIHIYFRSQVAMHCCDRSYYFQWIINTRRPNFPWPVNYSNLHSYIVHHHHWAPLDRNIREDIIAKALTQIENEPGITVESVGLSKMYLVGPVYAPGECYVVFLLAQYMLEIIAVIMPIIILLRIVRARRENDKNEKLISNMLRRAHKALIRQAKESHGVSKELPCDNLRDAIFEQLGFAHGSSRQYALSKLWPVVKERIQLDSRVSERNQLHHGHEVTLWEWVSPCSLSVHTNSSNSGVQDDWPRKQLDFSRQSFPIHTPLQ